MKWDAAAIACYIWISEVVYSAIFAFLLEGEP
jgi:hypothetical protein